MSLTLPFARNSRLGKAVVVRADILRATCWSALRMGIRNCGGTPQILSSGDVVLLEV
jgi:hypothetical protein